MVTIERNVIIEWKLNPSFYAIINSKNFSSRPQRIGSAINSVNKMLTRDEMMRTLMPIILGIDPTSNKSDWSKELAEYWNSLSIIVPEAGLTLDTSLMFDIEDAHSIREKYVKDYITKHKITSSKEFAEKALKGNTKIDEELMYRYAQIINPEHYVWWVYCQGYRGVANSLDTVGKSENINFFMYTQEDKDVARRQTANIMTKAMTIYGQISDKPSTLRDVLIVMKPESTLSILKLKDEDLIVDLYNLLMTMPDKFTNVASSKTLTQKALLEKYIALKLFKKLEGTGMIVDGIDTTKVIGSSHEEAISYFSNESSDVKKYLNELELRFKQMIK